jgi:hypothetical protein
VDTQAKRLDLQISQNAGVLVHCELMLEKEFKKQQQGQGKPK